MQGGSVIVAVLVSIAIAPSAAATTLEEGATVTPRGGVAAKYGYPAPALALYGGDLLNLRNIQGGIWDPARPSMLNLDIGAGSTQHPGRLLLGADVSREVRIHAGNRLLASFRDGNIYLYRRPKLMSRRGWRHLQVGRLHRWR